MKLEDCEQGTCPVTQVKDESSRSLLHTMPTVGLGFGFGPGELSYQFQLDPIDLSHSVHQITTGIQF